MMGRIGIVDVGGGLRGIYAAGVLDRCMEHGIQFDLGIGVSAGSANLASKSCHFFYLENCKGQPEHMIPAAPVFHSVPLMS